MARIGKSLKDLREQNNRIFVRSTGERLSRADNAWSTYAGRAIDYLAARFPRANVYGKRFQTTKVPYDVYTGKKDATAAGLAARGTSNG